MQGKYYNYVSKPPDLSWEIFWKKIFGQENLFLFKKLINICTIFFEVSRVHRQSNSLIAIKFSRSHAENIAEKMLFEAPREFGSLLNF